MFKETVLGWIAEMEEKGTIGRLDEGARTRLVDDYAVKLEEFFTQAVTKQLKPTGKAADFERMMIYDGQYVHKFLNQAIPGYYGFRAEIFEKARKAIIGE
ncbi:MAG: hypothetical protein M0Q23_08975 [Syntrophales bacterium]|jgi:hypothetical protein|nr:hypothetical protein [Syntrophales bacterium]MCK9528752.1 hypothetical protein [Syntrophales bacterium]MDX9922508.1 hypothetical protein [Syntrophales bacterium]